MRGLSTEPLRTLDSLAVLRQDSDKSCNGQQASTTPAIADSKTEPRQSSYVLEIHPRRPNSPAKRLRQATSLKNFRELAIMIPKLPGTIEGSPEKSKSLGAKPSAPDAHVVGKYSSSTQKRGTFNVSLAPKPERQPSRLVTTLTSFGYSLAPLYDIWERLQVSHCGQYSVERMLALDEYCQRVSIGRVVAVCLLFPLGPLLIIVLAECMPLQPVEKGPLENYVFWIRHTLMGALLVVCAMWQAKAWIPEMGMTMKQVLVVAIASATAYTVSNILVADLWVFPIPFLVVAGAPLMLVLWAVVSRIVLGPCPLEGVQDGAFRGRQFLLLTAVHASLLGLYPAYQAIFLAVDGLLQLGMIALLPAINLALKTLQTAIGSHLEDNLPEVLIFSIDVFSAIYSVLCMHSANSMEMVTVTLGLNTLVLLLSLHGMNRRSRVARACRSFQLMERQQQNLRRRQSLVDSFVTGGGSPGLLTTLVNTTLRLLEAPGQLDTTELRTIRLLSGIPQKLSDSNVALLDALAARCVYNNSRTTPENMPVAEMKDRYSSVAMEGRPLSTSHFPISRSKLLRRLRAVVLVIPTTRWLSLRITSHTSGGSPRFRSDHRNASKGTESEESEAEKFSSSCTQASTTVSELEAPAPRLSNVSKALLSRQQTIRRSVPALWQETSEKLLPLVSKCGPVISNVLEETRKQNTRAVKQTLQLLFNNEYLGLIAYTQCIIPVLYLLYMPMLQALPNHVYYPTHYRYFGNASEFDERMMVVGILALMQLVVFVTLQVFVVKRFGVSTLFQVAFVLESRFGLLQGRLLMWLIFAIQSTLVHYGTSPP
ncbi:hypothetical protein PHYPSEUDO_000837 [Phytophthora pseudosyringae]|uniref:Transmembrane protein n=1 Tax=Phytophthora pseudosyringae TaxID=221518 RepID=A0A8T1WL34_9STRA|nr:hypothetical protein PHYPSEUDO_000837 [Phytophthora pseudosyringae]